MSATRGVSPLCAVLAMLLTHTLSAQLPASLAGCYSVTRGAWTPSMGADSMGYRIPAVVRLDTLVAAIGGGWVLSPNIAYASKRTFPGAPRWWVHGDTLRLLWSNGYTPTQVTLRRSAGRDGAAWVGEAIALTDVHPLIEPRRPRATIQMHPQACVRV